MLLLSALFACAPTRTETPAGASLEVANYTSSECTARLSMDTAGGVPESIVATSDTASTVHIAHTSLSANCCADITPTPSVDGSTIALGYGFTGDECDCVCTFDLAYDITGVASGTYTVAYGDLSASVTVE